MLLVERAAVVQNPAPDVEAGVEVATGTLWLAILTFADVVSPLRMEWTAVVLGIAATDHVADGSVAMGFGRFVEHLTVARRDLS
jgi:hypothetical protein